MSRGTGLFNRKERKKYPNTRGGFETRPYIGTFVSFVLFVVNLINVGAQPESRV
jgi:hypothetical protein